MRPLNLLGNKFFALAFSFLLSQRLRDTLCGTKVLWKSDYEKIAANRGYFVMWMFVNFYAISMLRRPWRFVQAVINVMQGVESTRFAKWLNDIFVVRARWNKQFRKLSESKSLL